MLRQRSFARAGAVRNTTARAAKGVFIRQCGVWRAAGDQRTLRLRSRDQDLKGTHVCRSAFQPTGCAGGIGGKLWLFAMAVRRMCVSGHWDYEPRCQACLTIILHCLRVVLTRAYNYARRIVASQCRNQTDGS